MLIERINLKVLGNIEGNDILKNDDSQFKKLIWHMQIVSYSAARKGEMS